MKIRPKIPMLQGGNNIWYNGIQDYDPTRYTHAYDTSRLVNPLDFGEAWASRVNGNGRGRYTPNPNLSREQVRNIENTNNYYQRFTEDLFNSDGTLSDVGKAYARLSDSLLPENSLARVYNGDQIRSNWTTTNNDTYGRPGRSFSNINDYLRYERNDNLPGGRHNVFLKKGKRYFYVDNEGNYHWVSPEDAAKFQVTKEPVEYGWGDDGVYWEDYELTGPLQGDQIPPGELPEVTVTARKPQTSVPTGHRDHYGFDWNKLKNGLSKALNNPNLYALGRLAGNLYNNERVYDEQLKGIKPALKQTYNTHRQIVGDEATKQAYYRRAAAGQTKASRPFTSDADRQMAYQMEARRVGDELRAQGDLADNAEIRRTSDESNQHQWANTQRATEVANYNNAAINQANALKHNLLAQKHSAQWSSIDNYLKGIEYRKRQQLAEQQDLDDQIFALQQQNELSNDPRIISGKRTLQSVLDKHKKSDGTYDYDNDEVKNAIRNWKSLQTQITIEAYRKKQDYYKNRNNIIFSKSGSKITHKKKDDLLYKSTKDVVEHFRKMSKLSSDAQNRKKPKIEKLTPHPKGNSRRKYQQGGVAPFTIYTPVALGGETTSQTAVSSGSSKSSSSKSGENDTLDMIKELFKAVLGKGLPSDVNRLYTSMQNLFSRAQAFGEEISSDDIASMYLSQMQELNKIEYLKNNFDKAKEKMISNDGVNEIAVNAAGQIVTQDKDGKIKYAKSLADAEEKGLTPLTNGQVADLRSLVPSLAGRTDLDDVLANGIGLSKIAAHIKNLIPSIGTDKLTQEGYTKVQAGQIQKGFEALLNAPDGDYSYEENTETQKRQRAAALGYIATMLPRNMKAVLKVNADLQGVKPNEILEMLITSGDSKTQSIKFTPVTGKAAKGNKSGEGDDDIDSDKIKTNPLLAMQRGMGGVPQRYELVTKDSNTSMSVNGVFYSALPKVKDDMSIDKMLSESGIDGILDSKYGITFGDQQINPENLKDIMYSNTGGIVVTLPCKIVNGRKQVNLSVIETYEKAEKEALALAGDRQSPQFEKLLGEKLKEYHLDSLTDGNGRPNRKMFAQFLVVEAYTTDKIKFDTKSKFVEKVQNPDDNLEKRMNSALSTNDKKNDYNIDSKNHWFEMFYDDIYRGTMFIPLNNNPNSAMNSWGNSDLKIDQSQDLEELYQLYNKSTNYNNNNSLE